uniref:Uncharacterized protein n=1 Tax=Anguilla anguilla TaxID=7936 RepID=A0A0E9UY45_ANGAN
MMSFRFWIMLKTLVKPIGGKKCAFWDSPKTDKSNIICLCPNM